MDNQIDNISKSPPIIQNNPQMGNQFCNAHSHFSDNVEGGSGIVHRDVQNDELKPNMGKPRKWSLKQSSYHLDPDSHIVSKQSIRNFANGINKNMVVSSGCSGETKKPQQYGVQNQNIACKQYIESEICIRSSQLQPEYRKQQQKREIKEIQQKQKLISKFSVSEQKRKLISKLSVSEQKKCSKIGIESRITIQVQDEDEIQTNGGAYLSSQVKVDLGATDKSIAQYYKCQ